MYESKWPWGTVPDELEAFKKRHAGIRTIKTARTVESINEGVDAGFRPLFELLFASKDVYYHVAELLMDNETGRLAHDTRRHSYFQPAPERMHRATNGATYYPYRFPSPYAAYLLPPDLKEGEVVWLKDVIGDIPSHTSTGREFHVPRVAQAPATWLGKRFRIEFTPTAKDTRGWIG